MAHPGIILAVAATIIYNLGFILEKRALDRLPAIEAHRLGHLARTLFTAPAWRQSPQALRLLYCR